MRAGGKIGENFFLAKIYAYTITSSFGHLLLRYSVHSFVLLIFATSLIEIC